MSDNQFKSLAASAKHRLKNGFWQRTKEMRSEALKQSKEMGKDPKSLEDFLVKQTAREMCATTNSIARCEEELYNKVCRMLDEDIDVMNPIEKLLDKSVYEMLDHIVKQRYVLALMFKYAELKERYEAEKRRMGEPHLR